MKRTCKYLAFGAAAVLIAMMMAATVVERLQGTPVAFQWFYHSPLFILLWAVAAIAGVIYLVMEGTPKRLWTMGLHIGLVVILAGALVTFLFGTPPRTMNWTTRHRRSCLSASGWRRSPSTITRAPGVRSTTGPILPFSPKEMPSGSR